MLDPADIYEELYSEDSQSISAYARYFETSTTGLNSKNRKTKRTRDQLKISTNPLNALGKREPAYFAVARALDLIRPERGDSILEIGSGLGYLTEALNVAGYNAHGIDISANAVSHAKNVFHPENYSCTSIDAIINSDQYDLVVATEVIEHVQEPLDFLRKSLELLKPGGSMIITTPNRSFFPADMVWESSLPPVHHWWFTEKSLEVAANKLNVEILFIDFKDFFTVGNTLIWDTKNLKANYQGSQNNLSLAVSSIHPLLRSGRKFIAHNPWIMYLLSFILRSYKQKRFLVAGRKCHTTGVVLRKSINKKTASNSTHSF
jgi:SAM-dependent methyltransferase